jgi:hypothetical protein
MRLYKTLFWRLPNHLSQGSKKIFFAENKRGFEILPVQTACHFLTVWGLLNAGMKLSAHKGMSCRL